MPEHDCLPTDQSAADIVATLGGIAGLPARAARQRASDVLDLVRRLAGFTSRSSSPPTCSKTSRPPATRS